MRSPWEGGYPSKEDNRMIDRGPSVGAGMDQRLLGRLIERSTSAPPLSSDEGFGFSDRSTGSSLFGRDQPKATMAPLFENRMEQKSRDSIDFAPPPHSATNIVRPQSNRPSSSSHPSYAQADISSFLGENFRPESASHPMERPVDRGGSLDIGRRHDDALDSFSRVGMQLGRSQSAAPSIHGKSTLFPPPGLTTVNNGTSNTSDYKFDSAVDHGAEVMKIGLRRPASTGLVGDDHSLYTSNRSSLVDSNGGAVRPAAKTLMDLISEGMPENPHSIPETQKMETFAHHETSYPEKVKPSSHPIYNVGDQHLGDQRRYARQQQRQQVPHEYGRPEPHMPDRGMQAQRPRNVDAYDMSNVSNSLRNDIPRQEGAQYVQVQEHPGSQILQPEPMVQGSIYAPATIHQPHGVQPHGVPHTAHVVHRQAPPGQPEVQPQIFYGNRTQQVDVQQPQLIQSGQTLYLNASPGAPYGFATVQYHQPPPQQAHIYRQSVPGRGEQQYVSVVPIQSGTPQLASIGQGGTYAYWQPEVAAAGNILGPQVTIMNATGPNGAPIQVARIGNPVMDPPHSNNGYGSSGGRGKEKSGSGKSRRGGPSSRRGGGGESKHAGHSVSSPLLEEFRATKNRDWNIRDIEGHVVEFCQDQNGSRFIQQRLELGDASEHKIVMSEVLPAIHRLRNDVFGNYVVQKLLEFGSPKIRSDVRDTLQGEMLHLSLQMYGCRVVQKALETLDEDDLPHLLREFHHNVLSCIHDQNGNHVIQKCIEVMSNKAKKAREMGIDVKADFLSEQIDFVVDDVIANVASLSCHPYGCRVLQRILEHCIEQKKTAALNEILKCHKKLLDDQYGNYVIQHVLQFGRQSDRESILNIVVESGLLTLSKQKFASNVVEKLLKYGTPQQRKAVVREMLKVVDDETGVTKPAKSEGTSVVLLMVRDAYANYVVQTTLDVVQECEERRLLLEELNAHAVELRNYTFAKHIVTKLST